MKKSEFKAQIREEIIDILEADAEDIQAQQDLNNVKYTTIQGTTKERIKNVKSVVFS